MEQIIEQILGEMDQVIEDVGNKLPKDFPDDVSTPIFDGMKRARSRMK